MLHHPNIARTLDAGLEGEELFMAMELVQGKTIVEVLNTVVPKEGSLPPDLVARIGLDVLAGLEHAHTRRDEQGQALGIVHRDLSPANLMIGYDGVARIIDFGVAQARFRDDFHTRTGFVVGTLRYLSPEQAVGGQVDARSDLYTLGVVLYEMLASRALVESDEHHAAMAAIVEREPPSLHSLASNIPPDLEEVVHRALAKSPTDRWQTAAEFRIGLGRSLPSLANPKTVAGMMERHFHEDAGAMRRLATQALQPESSTRITTVMFSGEGVHYETNENLPSVVPSELTQIESATAAPQKHGAATGGRSPWVGGLIVAVMLVASVLVYKRAPTPGTAVSKRPLAAPAIEAPAPRVRMRSPKKNGVEAMKTAAPVTPMKSKQRPQPSARRSKPSRGRPPNAPHGAGASSSLLLRLDENPKDRTAFLALHDHLTGIVRRLPESRRVRLMSRLENALIAMDADELGKIAGELRVGRE
jgi:serine/threonine-protein kinase